MRVYQSIKGAQGGDIFDVQPAIAVFDEGGIIVPSYPHMVEVSISDGIANDLQGLQTASFNNSASQVAVLYFPDVVGCLHARAQYKLKVEAEYAEYTLAKNAKGKGKKKK